MEVANQDSGLKYYTFVSQIENGYGRVPSRSMADWARALGVRPRSLLWYTARRYIGCCSRSGGHDVVFLADARAKRRSRPSNRWAFNEVAELARLYRAKYSEAARWLRPRDN